MNDLPPTAYIILGGIIILLLILSLIFSIAESSFLSMNKLRLRIKRQSHDVRALRVGKLLDKKEQLFNTLLIANDIVNILLSALMTALCIRLFGTGGVAYATGTAALLLLVFGEITPKTISTRHADAIAYALSGFINRVVVLFRPLAYVLTGAVHVLLRITGIDTQQKKKTYTEEEIKIFIDYSSETGVLANGENIMMNRIFKFTDLAAQDIMTPRTKITALPFTAQYEEILSVAQTTAYARFPVYKTTIDDIIGVLYLKDLLHVSERGETFSVTNVMRPPLFILGTKKMSSVQQLLRENRQSLAIIVDEYSGTDGILTQEDIAHAIFGDVAHAADIPTSVPDGVQSDFTISGSTLLRDMKTPLGFPLESTINETLGGWLEERLDRLPKPQDVVWFNGYRFTICSVDARRVGMVHITACPAHEGTV
ncbi:MAG: HlyC/CorC family transporter [Treponema sp.]|nr:HlyC/CorC family transporter [Treponema sp.]